MQDADTWLLKKAKLEFDIDESQITRKKTRIKLKDTAC